MPKLSPRSIAYDTKRGVTYLLAHHGKDRMLLVVDGDALRLVRKLPSTVRETFWIAPGPGGEPCAVFAKIGATIIVPLPDGKPTTLKHASDSTCYDFELALVPPIDARFGVLARAVHRFDGDRWTEVDGATDSDALVIWATVHGTYRRRLRGCAADWTLLVDQQVVRPVLAALPDGSHIFLGSHGGQQRLIDAHGGHARLLDMPSTWACVACDGRFFLWCDRKVQELAVDGTRTDTGVTGEPHGDRCLFVAGEVVYFVEGTTLHRRVAGAWTRLDVAALGAAIGLA